MLISWNWLNRHIDLEGLDPKEVGAQFTLKVAELDDVYEIGAGLDGVKTARIERVRAHPDAKKLSIVNIHDGAKEHELVCGAPNVKNAEGSVVAWVQPGTTLPNGMEIAVAEIRGVVSQGMLASESELGLSDDHDGILLLPASTAIGVSISEAVPIHDWVWEVDNKAITHRADLWGHYGIAREVSMLTGRELRPLSSEFSFGDTPPVQIAGSLPQGCLRYLSTRIDNINVQPSPIWLQRLLLAAGIRPVSNIVDLTNLVMLETGNPMHAFDSANLRGGTLAVNMANESVSLETLDGQTRKVAQGTLLICDGEGPVAVAGVMGCENSQITTETKSITIEAACFDAEQVRRASLDLGLRTDSSARFEKALAPEMCSIAAHLFCVYLKKICPEATFDYALLDRCPTPREAQTITLSISYAEQRLGLALPSERVLSIFGALGLDSVLEGDTVSVKVPYWRAGRDLNHAEDLIEELGRSIGYFAIPGQPPLTEVRRPPLRPGRIQERAARRIFSLAGGYHEVLSYAFGHGPTKSKLLLKPDEGMALANPISSDWDRMRRSLIPNLLKAAVDNRRYNQDVNLFELGRVFEPVSEGVGPQPRRVGWIGVHSEVPTPKERHLIAQRSLIVEYLNSLNLTNIGFSAGVRDYDYESQWMHPTRSLTFTVDGITVGYLGTLHPRIAKRFDELGSEVWFGEVDLDRLPAFEGGVTLFQPLPKFPAISFDLSLEVPLALRSVELVEMSSKHFSNFDIFEKVELFSVFVIDDERKSLSLRFSFRAPDRSLEDSEVNSLMDAFIETLKTTRGIHLRSD